MKILHTSDWHVGRTIRGRSRADEHRNVLAEIASIAAREAVDLVLVAGDLFDVVAPSAEAEQIVFRALLDLAGVAPVVMVAGNHENPRRLEAVAPLLELGRVVVGAAVRRPTEGGVIRITTAAGETARIALVPFLSQRNIVSAGDLMEFDADQHRGLYAERLAAILAGLSKDLTTDEVNLMVAHLMVAGGVTGGGERSAHTIFDYAVPAQAFDPVLSYAALGHLHRSQRIPAAAEVWYSGSPLQLDFGETEDRKAVLVVEVEAGMPARVREVPLASGRALRLVRGTLEQVEALAGVTGDAYLRVELDEKARSGLAERAREVLPNAVDVVLAPRSVASADAVVPPVRLGRPPGELFREYLTGRNVSDDALARLFDTLLAEAHEA